MNILSIDSSGQVVGCSIIKDNKLLAEIILDDKLTHSQTLMPMIDNLFSITDLSIKDIDYIAVSNGPGSFTGLRIGVSTAIGLSRGCGAKVIGVSTLLGLAHNIVSDGIICPIMDARRNQVYTAIYQLKNGIYNTLLEPTAIEIDKLIKKLDNFEKVTLLGDGVIQYRDLLLKNNITIAPLNMLKQKSSSIGLCAYEMIVSNNLDNNDINIEYLRQSQAERERNAKGS